MNHAQKCGQKGYRKLLHFQTPQLTADLLLTDLRSSLDITTRSKDQCAPHNTPDIRAVLTARESPLSPKPGPLSVHLADQGRYKTIGNKEGSETGVPKTERPLVTLQIEPERS